MKKQCMILIVENHAGVLARVSSLFCQRGFNIDSLTVSFTDDPSISRITVMTSGDERTFSQIIKQTEKLIETKMIFSVEPEFSMLRELLLLKLSGTDANRDEMEKAIGDGGAQVIDRTNNTVVAELTGTPQQIDDFLLRMAPYRILEMCRSGATAMERGHVAYDIENKN